MGHGSMIDQGNRSAKPRPPVMRMPRELDVELTARCNLRCTYCYFFDNPAVEYHDLSTEAWLRFFEECGRLGIMNLTLAGGEPFIRKDLRKLIEGIVHNRMRFSILSNGGLINDDIAAFIAETGRCDFVQISLDGSCPETHDVCRGRGSFERAVRGIHTLQRNGVPVTVRMTIHRHNVQDLENTARFLLEDLGIPDFSTNAAGYLGSCRYSANNVLLTIEQRQEAMESLLRLSQRYNGRITATAGPLAEARMWRQMEAARVEGAPHLPDRGYLTGCGCHWNKIAVRADGAMVTCTMLAHMVLGWINQDSLQGIWQHSLTLKQMRQRHLISLASFADCEGCPYISYCTGNCPGLAYTLSGQVHHPSPDACLRRFLVAGGEIPQAVPGDSACQGAIVR
jgi:SynChlorMet cassette radical SAM/SPASM protein ScmE